MSRFAHSASFFVFLVALSACGRSDIVDYDDEGQDASEIDGSVTDADAGETDAADADEDVVDADAADATQDASKTCDACNGCCLDGTCIALPKQTSAECGFGGNACESCGPNGNCFKGACVHPQPDCGPLNCTGCCFDANDCSDGISADACGQGGDLCQGCGTKTCIAQKGGGGSCQVTCSPQNCAGCCAGASCVLGQSVSACGNGGKACVACPQGESCNAFAESGGSCQLPCSPKSCSGCCVGDLCAVGNQDIACGSGGGACADCADNQLVCVSGKCQP